MLSPLASCPRWTVILRGLEGNRVQSGFGFAVLQAIGDHTQSERLCAGYSFGTRRPIGQHAWQLWDLGNPATVFLAFDLYGEAHDLSLPRPCHDGRLFGGSCRNPAAPSGATRATWHRAVPTGDVAGSRQAAEALGEAGGRQEIVWPDATISS